MKVVQLTEQKQCLRLCKLHNLQNARKAVYTYVKVKRTLDKLRGAVLSYKVNGLTEKRKGGGDP